jgi:diguanylate cyclase (GGDEF)-like protein
MNIHQRDELKFYDQLSHWRFLKKSYNHKINAVALLGVCLPLVVTFLSALIYLPLGNEFHSLLILAVILVTTIVSAIMTVFLLKALLLPIILTAFALRQYIDEGKIPKLPITYQDTVGQLMLDTQYAIERLELLAQSQETSSDRDPLTGYMNRRAGEERLRQDLARAYRTDTQILVAVADLDKFKKINTDYGHHVGDICLIKTVEFLSNSIREGDWLARWDADQFLIVFWNFNHAMPIVVLERLQQHLVELPDGESLRVTLNIGATLCKGGIVLEALNIHVSRALSEAKRTVGISLVEETLTHS